MHTTQLKPDETFVRARGKEIWRFHEMEKFGPEDFEHANKGERLVMESVQSLAFQSRKARRALYGLARKSELVASLLDALTTRGAQRSCAILSSLLVSSGINPRNGAQLTASLGATLAQS